MFPGRLAQLPPAMFAQLANLLEHEKPGAPVINLSVGDPRGSVPSFVTEAIAKHAHQFGEYPAINGTEDWRSDAATKLVAQAALSFAGRRDACGQERFCR